MGDPNNPNRIFLTISPPGELDLAREIQRRADGQHDAEWQSFVNQSLGAAEEGGKAMGEKKNAVKPPAEPENPVRKGLDSVLRTMTGVGIDELQQGVEQGTLGDKVSARLGQPIANISEALVRDAAKRSGLPDEVIEKMVASVRNPTGTTGEESARILAEAHGLSGEDAQTVGRVAGLIAGALGTPSVTAGISKAMTPERLATLKNILTSERGSIGRPPQKITGAASKFIHEAGPYQNVTPEILREVEQSLPALKAGHTRLFRAEGVSGRGPYADDMAKGGPLYFTKNLETAFGVARDVPGRQARIVYLDIPTSELKAPTVGAALGNALEEYLVTPGRAVTRKIAVDATTEGVQLAGPVNLARVGAEQSVKTTIKRLDELMATPKKTITHEQTIAAGQARGMSIEEALNLSPEALSLSEARATQQALRDLHNKMATVIDDLRKAAMNGDATAAEDLARVWMIPAKIGANDKLMGTGAGQILEARKITSQADRAAFTMEEFAQVSEKLAAEGVDGFEIARYLTQIQGQRKRMGFLTAVWNGYKNVQDAFHWLFLQFVLSGPQTHAANIAGTGAIQITHYPERYVAEWINRAFFQNPDGVQRGETWAAMKASGRGASEGLQFLGKAIKTGEQPFGPGRIEARFDITAKGLGLDPDSAIGKIADVMAMVSPTRLMMGEDAAYKGFVYRTELAALSLREALKRTSDPVELGRIAQQLERNPTGEMQRLATEAALIRTLNSELGKLGSSVMAARNAIPGGWVVAPFLQTPGNSYNWWYRRAPVLSLVSIQNWTDVAQGGATRDMALSRMVLGNVIGLAVAHHVLQGDIVGGLPVGSNKNLKRDTREIGLQPYTIRVGDEFYGYKRTDPVGTYIGTIATAIEIYSQLHPGDTDFYWEDFAIAAALTGSRVALDTPWLSGVSNVMAAITHPDTDSKKMAQGFARSIVPAALRTVTRSGVPGVVEGYPEIRELDSLLDVVKADVPWLVTGVAPYLHPITGDTVERPPGWGPDAVSPIFVSHRRDDPVLMEIIRHKMNFNEPPKMAWGRQENMWSVDPTQGDPDGVKLSPGQYFSLKHLATREIRDGQGRNLHDAMAADIQSDAYKNASRGPDGGKELRLKILYHDFYQRAMAQLRREDKELDEAIRAKRETRLRQQLPETSPQALPPRIAPDLPAALIRSLTQ